MKRTLDPVIDEIRELILRMGACAEAILAKSLRAVFERDVRLAAEVKQDDLEIDQLDVDIDNAVLKALALQAPVATDLREVIAAKMVATDLERVGDIARNIAKSAKRLGEGQADSLGSDLVQLGADTQAVLRKALDAFTHVDAAAARAVIVADDRIDEVQDKIVADTVNGIPANPESASHAIDKIFIAKNLERVADHATNIAEDVILMAEALNVKHEGKLAG